VEPGTAFSRQYKPGDRPLPSDAIAAEMYRTAQRRLTDAGFEHYEISNYARPGYQCRHNRVYWENRPFYGFGMGAASYLQGTRFTRPRKTQEYAAWVHAGMPVPVSDLPGNQSPSSPDGFSPGYSLAGRLDELLEGLMLGLRLAEGVDLARLIEQFGEAAIARVWHRLSPFMQRGWVATVPGGTPGILPTTGRLQLTDPEGFLFSNVVLTELFEEFDLDSPPPNDRAS
jgi:oxygen-independent coproporphyrinogen-3 oxidase